MEAWKNICGMLIEGIPVEKVRRQLTGSFDKNRVYKDSINQKDGAFYMIAVVDGEKKLVVCGKERDRHGFTGREADLGDFPVKICELNNENCSLIRKLFPFTNPVSHKGFETTMGFGDRLGLASPGHIKLLKGKKVFPVLAQQSIRELNLTGRSYTDVLSAASWAVFQEGYTSGFGADGDHLKTVEEIKMALDCGFTMITLDCSEHIDNRIYSLSPQEIEKLYLSINENDRQYLESIYIGREFVLKDNTKIIFSREEFIKTVLIYLKAIRYTIDVYKKAIESCGRAIDFEMSIDETTVPTTPEAHFFVAGELLAGGVDITSLAPRFCGEFQKGIDYKGDIKEFEKSFDVHVKIADYFGYKVSVHSGSDKFSVFPIIGKKTGGRYHLKTAGTNWLEAVRVIACKSPSLYREMHSYALSKLADAKKYYHITENVSNIPDINTLKDNELSGLMDMDDARQVLHITYGMILQGKNPDGSYMFRDRIYDVLNRYEAEYYQALERHLGKHLDKLGLAGR